MAAGAYGPSNEHPTSMITISYRPSIHTTTPRTPQSTQMTNFGLRVPGQAPVAPHGLNSEAGDSPAEWGRRSTRTAKDGPDVFVRDQGGGARKITHVLWVPGGAPPGLETSS
jgi:hypothetical protein